jgi:hypothetical protein
MVHMVEDVAGYILSDLKSVSMTNAGVSVREGCVCTCVSMYVIRLVVGLAAMLVICAYYSAGWYGDR